MSRRPPPVLATAPPAVNALVQRGRRELDSRAFDDAVETFTQACARAPGDAACIANLGEAYRQAGRWHEATRALLIALSRDPDLPEPTHNVGLVLEDLGEIPGAEVCFDRATRLRRVRLAGDTTASPAGNARRQVSRREGGGRAPRADLAAMLTAIATAIGARRPTEDAVVLFRRAIELQPGLAAAHANLGAILLRADRVEEGATSLRRALEINPEDAASRLNLGSALLASARHGDAIEQYRRAIALKPGDAFFHSHLLWSLHFAPGQSQSSILDEARAWDRQHAAPLAATIAPHSNMPEPNRRLRVGYVSADFRWHCQRFFVVPLFTHHDRGQIEIFCYSNVRDPDAMTDRIRGLAGHWRDIVGLDDASAAQTIRKDRIDILVDLTMHMDGNRLPLFARKPAPVQVCWLAYPGTTGMTAMDYRVTDRFLDPPERSTEEAYSERSIRLPDTFWCYDPLTEEPEVGPLPAKASGHVVFGSLNNFCKVNDALLDLWARVLRETAGSRLVLMAPPGDARRRVLGTFAKHGVESGRIDLAGKMPHAEYLGLYRRIDICLDPVPYNGHTTSLDAFWMGVPVVTRVGDTVVGRAGLCQAMNLGLPELVATTSDEYVAIAVALAGDLERLERLRASLRSRMRSSPLMDGARFARNLERAYREIWQRWCEGDRQS